MNSTTTPAPRMAPGWPGIPARWTSSAKSAVGTAVGEGSRVWFTASHGILNEVYYPELDQACLRDAGFMVTSADGYFSEEKRHCDHAVEWVSPGVPAFRLMNSCQQGHYHIDKRILTSLEYDAVLQRVKFTPRKGKLSDYKVTLLLGPHLGNSGGGNTGWVADQRGDPMLFAQRGALVMAVACSSGFTKRTVGYVGDYDAWHDVHQHGELTALYDRAENGNIALAAEIDLEKHDGEFTVAIAFASDPDTAALHARAALFQSFDDTETRYDDSWREWQDGLLALDEPSSESTPHLYRVSTAVMKSHMSLNNDGGAIASLSIPWGSSKGDGDLGGYHLVWPRDMVETAVGFLAVGAFYEVKAMLRFLAITQETDGRWPQNMWLNGTPYWSGLQLDEVAFPIILVDHAHREAAIDVDETDQLWPMVLRAAVFLLTHGPSTDQDRWEENAGYSPFTLAVQIAALLSAADLAELAGHTSFANILRDTADDWNARIEQWTYASNTPLSQKLGVAGYYVRIGSAARDDAAAPTLGNVTIKNRPVGEPPLKSWELISVDALALVRFGVRAADDPRMVDTVRVIDATLKTETPTGPTWRRYVGDGYGEDEIGSAFDGTGIGRGWPLLAGERAHYELAAGRADEAARLGAVMRAQATDGGMLPEQVWDAPDIPELDLLNGRPSGSAMPLVWAHAEYVKLLRSMNEGAVYDCPPQTHARYVAQTNTPRVTVWSFANQPSRASRLQALRIDVSASATVHWTDDQWVTSHDAVTERIMPGLHCVELPAPAGKSPDESATEPAATDSTRVQFTFYWNDTTRWEGHDFTVQFDE